MYLGEQICVQIKPKNSSETKKIAYDPSTNGEPKFIRLYML